MWNVLLKDRGINARHHNVVSPVHDEDRLPDPLELVIASEFGDCAPVGDGPCLRIHGRPGRRDVLVIAGVTTLPKGASCGLTCLTRGEEEIEEIFNGWYRLRRMLRDRRCEGVHTFSALWSCAGKDEAADQSWTLESELLGNEATKRKTEYVDSRQTQRIDESQDMLRHA